jgi:cell division protein FtsB
MSEKRDTHKIIYDLKLKLKDAQETIWTLTGSNQRYEADVVSLRKTMMEYSNIRDDLEQQIRDLKADKVKLLKLLHENMIDIIN